MAQPPPPPTVAKANVVKKVQEKVYTKSILIVSGQFFPYADWMGEHKKDYKKIYLTSMEVYEEMSLGDKKLYNQVIGFENFGTNSLLEYTANECVATSRP
jgi:hypothetical protein